MGKKLENINIDELLKEPLPEEPKQIEEDETSNMIIDIILSEVDKADKLINKSLSFEEVKLEKNGIKINLKRTFNKSYFTKDKVGFDELKEALRQVIYNEEYYKCGKIHKRDYIIEFTIECETGIEF